MVEHPDGGSAERLRIRTSYGLIAVRGTRVFAGFEGKALAVFVERGVVSVRAAGQTVLLRSGDGTSIPTPGARPTPVAQWKAKRIDALFGGIR
jgi:ferric-dicitrate binding protein FerR (iron transport regulator)